FGYTITDADGDVSGASLTITIVGGNHGVMIDNLTAAANGGDTTVNEANLADGSAANPAALTQNGDLTITPPPSLGSLTINGTVISASALTNSATSNITIGTPDGNTLKIVGYNPSTGVVNYTYTLLDNETHAAAGADSIFDNMPVIVTDIDVDSAS